MRDTLPNGGFSCYRCKTPETTTNPRAYCVHCRGRQASKLSFVKKLVESPYEQAVKRIEKVTGASRLSWEWRIGHPYCRAVAKYASLLIEEAKNA